MNWLKSRIRNPSKGLLMVISPFLFSVVQMTVNFFMPNLKANPVPTFYQIPPQEKISIFRVTVQAGCN